MLTAKPTLDRTGETVNSPLAPPPGKQPGHVTRTYTYIHARGSSGKEGGRRRRGVGSRGSRDDCTLSVFLWRLLLQQRFVARKLSWFDNPSVGLEAEETERKREKP